MDKNYGVLLLFLLTCPENICGGARSSSCASDWFPLRLMVVWFIWLFGTFKAIFTGNCLKGFAVFS